MFYSLNSMFLTPTNEIEIHNIIAELNKSKSTCLSDLPVDIIKRSAVSTISPNPFDQPIPFNRYCTS